MPRIFVFFLVVSASVHALEVKPYGFIKASPVVATRAVESFGSANLVGPIRAYPGSDSAADEARTSFQLSQSRAGINIGGADAVSGQLEIDFVDFEKASPVVRALPRLRIASVRYKASPSDTLSLGQDWDVFSPAKPHTFNFIGLYFGAGNAGFLRPQVKWTHAGERIKLEAAGGLAGVNSLPADSDLERGVVPSFAASIAYGLGEKGRVGFSAIAGRLQFSAGPTYATRGFYGVNGFFEAPVFLGELHAEMYYGENLANTGVLTMALGSATESRQEWGGYVTLKSEWGADFSSQLGAGYADCVQSDGSVLKGIAGYRVLDNMRVSTAVTYHAAPSLDFFLEMSGYTTRFLETATQSPSTRFAAVIESGAVYTF